MRDPPSRRRKGKANYGKQKRNLTFFGKWIDQLNRRCKTDQAEIARLAHIPKSTISKVTRGQGDIRRASVLRLLHIYEDLASKRQVVLREDWQQDFFLAWSGDDSLIDGARRTLEELEKE